MFILQLQFGLAENMSTKVNTIRRQKRTKDNRLHALAFMRTYIIPIIIFS